jgi:hypothetical protein
MASLRITYSLCCISLISAQTYSTNDDRNEITQAGFRVLAGDWEGDQLKD